MNETSEFLLLVSWNPNVFVYVCVSLVYVSATLWTPRSIRRDEEAAFKLLIIGFNGAVYCLVWGGGGSEATRQLLSGVGGGAVPPNVNISYSHQLDLFFLLGCRYEKTCVLTGRLVVVSLEVIISHVFLSLDLLCPPPTPPPTPPPAGPHKRPSCQSSS